MIDYLKGKLILELARHFGNDARRIDHALEVMGHAEAILEETPGADAEVVLAAAVTHDFGIVEAERRHGSSDGGLQEKYGPAAARGALRRAGLGREKARAVEAIIARRHSPPKRVTVEFRILYESDLLVNARDVPGLLEDRERLEAFIEKQFRTEAGCARARRLLLGDEGLFSRMGRVYKLLVDEERRREKEAPFLLDLAEEARGVGAKRKRARGATRVLDLACGTGFHARLLAEAGYRVTAIDYAESMLTEARSQSATGAFPVAIDYRRGDLLEPLKVSRQAGLTLLLGNTLSTFEKPKELRKALTHAAEATLAGGMVLCQVLNFARLAVGARPVTTEREGIVDGRRVHLTKILSRPDKETVLIHMHVFRPMETEGNLGFSKTTVLRPLGPRRLLAAARAAGLRAEGRWGNLARASFDKASSSDYAVLFRK